MVPRLLLTASLLAGVAACSSPVKPPPPPAADGGDGGAPDAGPYDAGVPGFGAADFCRVWTQTYCRWAEGCGQLPHEEAQRCEGVQRASWCAAAEARLDAGFVAFDAGAAYRCLLALEDARCGPLPSTCEAAYPGRVALGGACLAPGDCVAGFCARDGGCGTCTAPLPLGAGCAGPGECDDAGFCAAHDGGASCLGRLDAGVSCLSLGNQACQSGRCAFQAGVGAVCASSAVPPSCAASASCPDGWYCNEFGGCAPRLADGQGCRLDDACHGGACVAQKCASLAAGSVAAGGACSRSWQCQSGGVCAGGVCASRLRAGEACALEGLNVFVGCPYGFVCEAKQHVCAPLDAYCLYPGYCAGGPTLGQPCSGPCRGFSACATVDGGSVCVRSEALPGEACDRDLLERACAAGACAGVCPPAVSCTP